jgi:hypothetical protein
MKEHLGETKFSREMTDFVLQFDEETQEKWVRLFGLYSNEEEAEKDTEEFETLCSELRRASAELGVDPWPIKVIDRMRKEGSWPRDIEVMDMVCVEAKLGEARRIGDPIRAAIAEVTVVLGEAAFRQARDKARASGLSRLGVHVAAMTAERKVQGETPSEAEEFVRHVHRATRSVDAHGYPTSRDVSEAIDEVKRAGLWPWKGLD